jgi:membrane protein implicated in regulation of membrane protease activity
MKVLWVITLASSLIFIIQSILTFIGAGDSDIESGGDFDAGVSDPSGSDVDTATETDPGMNLLTFRNFINFCLGFGWTTVLLRGKIASNVLLMALGFLVGIALVVAVMWLFKWLSSMQQTGNINVYKSALGCQGKVYLTIPGERQGEGKVQITINNAVREYDALTDGDSIRNGASIRVIEVIDNYTLLVEEINPTII